jgi:hypothetical protein
MGTGKHAVKNAWLYAVISLNVDMLFNVNKYVYLQSLFAVLVSVHI